MRSNAITITLTLTFSAVTSLRERVLSTWNGSRHPFSRSYATTSASMMQDLTVGAIACAGGEWAEGTNANAHTALLTCRSSAITSGYLVVLSSRLRLNTRMVPSAITWIWGKAMRGGGRQP